MKTIHSLTALSAAALLALTLAGCAPASDTGSTDDAGTGSSESDSADDTGGGTLVTLSGSGDYTVGVDAPIGGYELKDADSQPDGCTWAIQDEDGEVQLQDQGIVVFLTEENKFFQTSGCPDWVQFE